jgi:hypothetical protein
MMPAVPPPAHIRVPVEVKLKPGWRYVPERRLFESDSGETFAPRGLPPRTRIVHKTPALAAADPAQLTKAEQDLRRYLQVILPPGVAAADHVRLVRAWPSVATAQRGPEISLPHGGGGPDSRR